jgi:hypothetical protein
MRASFALEEASRVTTPADRNSEPPPTAADKRRVAREVKIADGLQALEWWLRDTISQGLVAVHSRGYAHWDEIAARMVDAQAPGLARRLRKMASAASGERWEERLLEELAKLHLLTEAYKRQDVLPADLRAEVRTLVGWTVGQDELHTQAGVGDRWQVVGRSVTEEDRLRVQRTWLLGLNTGRSALTLEFSPGPQVPFENPFEVNTLATAELVFYPGVVPLRATVKAKTTPTHALRGVCGGYRNISDAVAAYAAALAKNPWIERVPFLLHGVVPAPAGEGFVVYDQDDRAAPLARRFAHGWRLLAMSGGHPVDVFGEWNGDELNPLSVWSDGRFADLHDAPAH